MDDKRQMLYDAIMGIVNLERDLSKAVTDSSVNSDAKRFVKYGAEWRRDSLARAMDFYIARTAIEIKITHQGEDNDKR